MSIREDILQAIQEDVIPALDEVWPDTYSILDPQGTDDGRGGRRKVADPPEVETGRCYMRGTSSAGPERVIADELGYSTPYTVELPLETILTPKHILVVNGRRLDVGGVTKAGNYSYRTLAVCQESS